MKEKKQLKQSRIGNFFKKTQPEETGCVPKDNQLQNKCKLLLSSHKSNSDVVQKTPEVAPKHKSLVNRRPPKSRLSLKRDGVKERQGKNVICIDEDENGQEKMGDRREPMSFGLSCERKNPICSKEDRNESFKDDTDSACLQNCHQWPIKDDHFKDNADIKGGTVSRVFTQIRPSNKSLTSSVSSKDNHVTARVKGGSTKMGNSWSGTNVAHDQSCHGSRLGNLSEESTCKTLRMSFDDDLMNRQKTSKLKLKRLDSSTKRVFRFASSGLSPMKKKQATDCDVAVKSCNIKDASLSMESGLCRKYSADGDASSKSSKDFGRRNLFATEISRKSDLHAKGKHVEHASIQRQEMTKNNSHCYVKPSRHANANGYDDDDDVDDVMAQYAKLISKNSFDKEKTDGSKVKKLDGVGSRESTGCENRGCHDGSAEGNRDINGSQDEIKDFAKDVSKLEGDLGILESSMNDFSERNRDTASVEGSMTGISERNRDTASAGGSMKDISERNRDTDSFEGSMNDFSERNRDKASAGGSMKDIPERNRDTDSFEGSMNDFSHRNRDTASVGDSMKDISERNRDTDSFEGSMNDFSHRNRDTASVGSSMKDISERNRDTDSFEGSMSDFSHRTRDTSSVGGSMKDFSVRNRDTDSFEGSMNDFSQRNRDTASVGDSMKDIPQRNRDTGSLDKNSIIDHLGDISLTDFNDSFFDLSNCEDLEDKKDKILDNKDATKGRLPNSKEASKELENMDLLHQSLLDISFGEDFDAASLATGRRDDTTVKSVLVLEVTRQEYHDSVTGTHMEKAVRLFDEETSTEALCYLRQDWETMDIFPGDSVFITGFKTCEQSSITLDNSSPMFLTLFPNTLLSSTTISMGITCQRRAVLSELFKTDGPNQAMFLGTFLHDLFDFAIDKKVFSVVELKRKASKLLENYDNLNTLYSLGASEVEFMEKVDEYATLLSKWGKKFLKDTPQTSDEIVDFKLGSSVNSDDVTRLSITEVVDIEENILCPSLGLKGKVDASVNVTVHRQPKVSKQNRQQQPASSAKYHIPFELKTGKMFSKLGSIEHRAQVILYTLMMSEKYEKTVEAGLLYYVKTGHLQGVPATRKEKRALLMKRNELVRFLSMENLRNKKLMPGLLKDEHSCKRCPLVTSCMVYHKNIEEGTSETSGIRQQFNELTGHLTKEESQYFLKWYHLIMLEAAETASSSSLKKMWTESSEQRQSSGACFSNMRIKAKVSEDERLKLYIFERKPSEAARDEATVRDCVISAGDRVVISEEQCKTFGITKGLVKTVSRSEISVLCTVEINTRSPISDTLFRIERDESLTSHNIPLGNLMKLFASQSEHDKKLRQLLVDLHSPRFNWFDVQTLLTTTDEDGTQQPLVLVNDSGKQTTITTKSQRRQIRSTFAGLNPDQKMAVEKCLTAQDYVMVLGMPGTGKTTTIACIVKGLVALGKTVLITSYTHSAVDNILLKVKEMNLDFLRLGKTNSIHQEILAFAVENATASIKTVIGLERFYEKKKIVGTTCLGVNHSLFLKKRFDYCIVDEASQITQPVCFGAIRCADVFVLVGDHYQLPPLVQSMQAKNAGMDVSLFRRLSEHHPSAVISLQHQYRMHRDIMTLANALIYDHRMQCGTEELEKKTLKIPGLHRVRQKMQLTQSQGHFIEGVLNPAQPVVYVDTDSVALHECETGNHISNQKEANLVAFIFRGLTVSGVQGREIGIISPYRRQLNLIRDTLNRCSAGSLADVEINTVDKYQGRDKSCIIVSFVRSNHAGNIGNLLKDWRRINVALTRAKHKLFLIGSRTTLSSSPVLKQLADVAHNNDWIIKVPVDILELSQ